MAIHIICGKPGGGKSLFGMHLLVRELVETERNIVTNLAVKLPELNEYVQKKFSREDYRVPQRLRILTDDETKKFWDHRSAENNDGSNGVAYFLDEAHEHFNAREWAALHRDALHYLSQHRKLGDVVFPITQAPGNLDKQFRSVAQDYIHVRNEYTAKYLIFRGMGRFVVKMFHTDPSQGSRLDYFDRSVFKLDAKGLANCYDTAKGVGVLGSRADKGARAKGLPIWTVFPMAAVGGMMCLFLPWLLAHGVTHYMGNSVRQKIAAVTSAVPNTLHPVDTLPGNAAVQGVLAPRFGSGQNASEASAPSAPPPLPPVKAMGYIVANNQVLVELSDGRTLHDNEVARITEWQVVGADGRVYEISNDVGHGTPPPKTVQLLPGEMKPPAPNPAPGGNGPTVGGGPGPVTVGNLAPVSPPALTMPQILLNTSPDTSGPPSMPRKR